MQSQNLFRLRSLAQCLLFIGLTQACSPGVNQISQESKEAYLFSYVHCLTQKNVSTDNYKKFPQAATWEVENNAWGAYLLDEPWYQCLRRYVDGSWGWNWFFPFRPWNVLAYPMIRYHDIGQSNAYFPRSINAVDDLKLQIHYQWYNLSDNFRGNMAPEVWIVNTSSIDSSNFFDFNLRIGEIMFWLDVKGGLQTGASLHSTYTTSDGVSWKLYINPTHQSHNLSQQWVYMAFVADVPQYNIEIKMNEMIPFALSKVREIDGLSNWCQSNCYVLDVEIGSEIMSGSGSLKIRHWKVIH